MAQCFFGSFPSKGPHPQRWQREPPPGWQCSGGYRQGRCRQKSCTLARQSTWGSASCSPISPPETPRHAEIKAACWFWQTRSNITCAWIQVQEITLARQLSWVFVIKITLQLFSNCMKWEGAMWKRQIRSRYFKRKELSKAWVTSVITIYPLAIAALKFDMYHVRLRQNSKQILHL